jgi:hypothetical protein
VLRSPLQHDQIDGVKEDQHHKKQHDLSSATEHNGKLEERLISYPNPPLHSHVSKIKIKPEAGKETNEYPVIEFRDEGSIKITISESQKYNKSIVVISSSVDSGSIPATTIMAETSYGISPVVGTSSNYSREDHTHGSPIYTASISPATTVMGEVSYGLSPVVGTGSLFARQDHTHGTPASDAVSPATTVMGEVTYGLSPVVGTGSLYARHDHTHGTPSAISVPSAAVSVVEEMTYGKTSAVGTGSEYAKNDHTHGTIPVHHQTIFTPIGFASADIPFRSFVGYYTNTSETDEEARALYLGRVSHVFSVAEAAINVKQSAVGLTWAEMAIFKGTPNIATGVTFDLLGYTDTSATFGTTGPKVVTINLSTSTAIGDHIWIAWGQHIKDAQQGDSPATFHPAVSDQVTSGMFQYQSATQPSAVSATAFLARDVSLEEVATSPLWTVVEMS